VQVEGPRGAAAHTAGAGLAGTGGEQAAAKSARTGRRGVLATRRSGGEVSAATSASKITVGPVVVLSEAAVAAGVDRWSGDAGGHGDAETGEDSDAERVRTPIARRAAHHKGHKQRETARVGECA